MKEITHKILFSERYKDEHKTILKECERAVSLGGTFKIENAYKDGWFSFITIYYKES